MPYLRLRVDYAGGFSVVAPRHFARHMEGKIANPQDCVLFFKSAGKHTSSTQGAPRSRSLQESFEDEADMLPADNPNKRQSLGH